MSAERSKFKGDILSVLISIQRFCLENCELFRKEKKRVEIVIRSQEVDAENYVLHPHRPLPLDAGLIFFLTALGAGGLLSWGCSDINANLDRSKIARNRGARFLINMTLSRIPGIYLWGENVTPRESLIKLWCCIMPWEMAI
ncbi:MAG: hypothetical protein RBG13Loki_3533 [Promethearchaeota archaeon CR_4]|nr:MAG: hypothetical protein RBG13Loki_3533 [Candidatus Lokiarchaeota archaeon CR_4]